MHSISCCQLLEFCEFGQVQLGCNVDVPCLSSEGEGRERGGGGGGGWVDSKHVKLLKQCAFSL